MYNAVFVFLLLLLSCSGLYAQKIVVGVVKNEQLEPIPDARITQDRGDVREVNFTDSNGIFHLLLDEDDNNYVLVSSPGYHPVQLDSVLQKPEVLQITLMKDPDYELPKYLDRSYLKNRGGGLYGMIDIVDDDFDEFEAILGEENIYTLNRMAGTFNLELAFMVKRFQYSFMGGLAFTSNPDPDSLDIELNNSVFGLSFGYRLIDQKRFFLLPQANFKWYKYRLINADLRDDDQLSTYVSQSRDLDIRIWQPTLSLGASLAFKLDGKIKNDGQFWTLGIYGGYLMKLRKHPHINGPLSMVNTDARIKVHPFNLGIFCSTNFDPKNGL